MPKRNLPVKVEPRKILKSFRLFPDDARRLKLGAEKHGLPETFYVQAALRAKFKEDGIE